MGVGCALALVFVLLTGLRAYTRWAPREDAPKVVLSVGADLVNDVGLHQAPYQAALAAEGAQVTEVSPRDQRSAQEILKDADALVLTGGGDVDPRLYGGDPDTAWLVDPARDAFEVALLREALRRDLPVLAVCRGIHLVNVAHGGTLDDLRADRARNAVHGITPRSFAAHSVETAPGSLARAANGERLRVNSFHGQAVGTVGPGLAVTAVAPDGVVEALEVPGARCALAVQWHPELDYFVDPRSREVFRRLLAAAREG
jgi:putative glutamine amidotransferase